MDAGACGQAARVLPQQQLLVGKALQMHLDAIQLGVIEGKMSHLRYVEVAVQFTVQVV